MKQGIFFLLALALLLTSGNVLWDYKLRKENNDPRYQIRRIAQTGPVKKALPTDYLTGLLSLSADAPTSLYTFDCREAKEKLLSSPLFREVSIKKEFPDTLLIDYEVRRPVVRLLDYANVAMDRGNRLFPLAPFFSPKEVPGLYLGLPPFGSAKDAYGRAGGEWLSPLENPFLQLAWELFDFLEPLAQREKLRIKCIDVSQAFAPTLGQREIVIHTEEEFLLPQGGVAIFPKLVRLSPKDYAQELSSFFILRRRMEADYRKQLSSLTGTSVRFSPRIIDLRIPRLAFVENQ
ncbi:MAG: FtsQ-type POTRA domain-containing protein [Verrucomicrobiota bacterium]|nr:FtsQ-type POTRA domain-containing protein [Verrucomicrobiota bacterium]